MYDASRLISYFCFCLQQANSNFSKVLNWIIKEIFRKKHFSTILNDSFENLTEF